MIVWPLYSLVFSYIHLKELCVTSVNRIRHHIWSEKDSKEIFKAYWPCEVIISAFGEPSTHLYDNGKYFPYTHFP